MRIPCDFVSPTRRFVAMTLLLGAAAVSRADGTPAVANPAKPRPKTYGTLDQVAYRIPSSDFTTMSSATGWEYDTGGGEFVSTRRYSTVRLALFIGPVHIPTGALVNLFELDYCDNALQLNVIATLEVYKKDGTFVQGLGVLQSNDDGCSLVFSNLPVPYRVANDSEDLVVRVQTEAGDETTSFSGVTLYYSLQMSPAPLTQTFADVPDTYLFFRVIEAMARSGITVGCGTGIYCPDQNVTRGEMAAFFSRALGLHFPDVPPGP